MIYYILFFISILVSLQLRDIIIVNKFKLEGFHVSFAIIILFSAFRFDVGYDFSMYYGLIDGTTRFLDAQINRLEFLSRSLVIFSSKIGFYQLFYIITSCLICIPIANTIKKNSLDPKLSTIIFISFPLFYFNSFSIIRQYVAVAIMFYSFSFIKKKQLLYYSIAIVLASLFHKSAFFAIPIYFVYQKSITLKKNLIIALYITGFFSSKIISALIMLFFNQYSAYVNGRITGEGGNILLILFQILGFLILCMLHNFKKTEKEFNFYIFCFYIGLFFWSSLAPFGHAGFRGSLYFIIFVLLLIPFLARKIKQQKLFKEITIIACTLMFFLNLYIGSKHKVKDPNMPYQIFLFKTSKDFKPNE